MFLHTVSSVSQFVIDQDNLRVGNNVIVIIVTSASGVTRTITSNVFRSQGQLCLPLSDSGPIMPLYVIGVQIKDIKDTCSCIMVDIAYTVAIYIFASNRGQALYSGQNDLCLLFRGSTVLELVCTYICRH